MCFTFYISQDLKKILHIILCGKLHFIFCCFDLFSHVEKHLFIFFLEKHLYSDDFKVIYLSISLIS